MTRSSLKRILILVETPFQLLCASEYMRTHEARYALCVRNSGKGTNDEQMAKMIEDMGIVVDRTIKASPERKVSCLKAFIIFIAAFHGRYDKVLIGSYFSRLMKLFATAVWKKDVVLLDDGMATLLADKIIRNRCQNVYSLYTIFDLSTDIYIKYEKHSLEATRRFHSVKAGKEKGSHDSAKAIFIGQKLVDIGFIDLDSYLQTVKWAVAECGGNTLYYVPHRGESQAYVAEIAKIPEIKIAYPDGAIEYFVLCNGWSPKYLFAVTSTALVTLASFFPEAKSRAIFPKALRRNMFPHWELVSGYLLGNENITICDGVV